MSSGDEEYNRSGNNEDPKALKKRRVTRACDTCRRKKIRCDGAKVGDKCANCAAYNHNCTYVEAAKKRGPPKGYVESLENRLQKMETLLQRLCPDADFTKELGVHMDRETWYNERNNRGTTSPVPLPPRQSHSPAGRAHAMARTNTSLSDEFGPSDDDHSYLPLSEDVQRLTVTSMDQRFHGKSSGLVLVQTAMDMKREYSGADITKVTPERSDFWNRPEWEGKRATPDDNIQVDFEFPPPDLMEMLISLYFYHNNLYLPILHRPTFEREYRDGLHKTNSGFANILLLVCAIASRCSDDPRVLRPCANHDTEVSSRHTAGWKYFDQVQMHRKSLIAPATLFDLQQYALAGIFLQGSPAPYASWVTVGIGLRVAQDVGAHRKREGPPTVEKELWKRAFWVLVHLDRLSSAALGRPCAIHDEDFDLDPPLEVDDEFWEPANPDDAFRQPSDVPSTVAYFTALIRLDRMLSFALRTIYSINKTKALLGYFGENNWAQDTVAELDTSLNAWITSVPEHLRWDPSDPSTEFSIFFQQSAILYATYYYIQVLVHRPFIPRPGKPPLLAYPSLAICTNAARSCGQVLQVFRDVCDVGSAPQLMFCAFTSGVVLLLNIWGMRKEGPTAADSAAPMQDVHRCMQFLKAAEDRWHLASRLRGILNELASVGDFPLPHPSPEVSNNKRGWDSDSPKSVQDVVNVPEPTTRQRPIARPRSLIAASRRTGPPSQTQIAIPPNEFGQFLPMDSATLGRMPLYHPSFIQATGSGVDSMTGVQMFEQTDIAVPPEGQFGSPPPGQPILQLYPPAGDTQPLYPASAPPFGNGFSPQQQHNGFSNTNTVESMPGSEQNPLWNSTLNMWSTAPPGFEWEDWNNFTTNMMPGPRLDLDQPPPTHS